MLPVCLWFEEDVDSLVLGVWESACGCWIGRVGVGATMGGGLCISGGLASKLLKESTWPMVSSMDTSKPGKRVARGIR